MSHQIALGMRQAAEKPVLDCFESIDDRFHIPSLKQKDCFRESSLASCQPPFKSFICSTTQFGTITKALTITW